jgi:hypothetical protein
MKYIVSWALPPATFHTAVGRFLEAGGMPPAEVQLLGRWHGMSGRGFAIVETSDPKALFTWVAEWSDLLPMETTPCLEDAEMSGVLQSLKR